MCSCNSQQHGWKYWSAAVDHAMLQPTRNSNEEQCRIKPMVWTTRKSRQMLWALNLCASDIMDWKQSLLVAYLTPGFVGDTRSHSALAWWWHLNQMETVWRIQIWHHGITTSSLKQPIRQQLKNDISRELNLRFVFLAPLRHWRDTVRSCWARSLRLFERSVETFSSFFF